MLCTCSKIFLSFIFKQHDSACGAALHAFCLPAPAWEAPTLIVSQVAALLDEDAPKTLRSVISGA